MLWVTESTSYPRRISMWNTKTGALVKELFGPTALRRLRFGAIYPKDPNVMVGEGCEWRLDPQTGQAACVASSNRGPGHSGRAQRLRALLTGSNGRDTGSSLDRIEINIYERWGPAI